MYLLNSAFDLKTEGLLDLQSIDENINFPEKILRMIYYYINQRFHSESCQGFIARENLWP